MKALKVIAKIVVALAAIAGIVYVVAAYGDRIAAWARKLLNSWGCGCCCDCDCDCEDCDCEGDCDDCDCDCECSCEEVPADGSAVVAEQADFES